MTGFGDLNMKSPLILAMKSTIRVCVVYSRDLAGMPMVTHGSVNFREPQPGREYPHTAKTAINGRRVKTSQFSTITLISKLL